MDEKELQEEFRQHRVVLVSQLPLCDIAECLLNALYDTRLKGWGQGSWAYLCQEHYDELSIGVLGLGKGQKLVLRRT